MTTTYLTSNKFTFTVDAECQQQLDAAIAKYHAEQEKNGFTGRVSYTKCGDKVTMEVGSLPIYSSDTSKLAQTVRAAMDQWLAQRVWMNTVSKSLRKLAYVYKGSLSNRVGHIGWCPDAKWALGKVTYACFGLASQKLGEFDSKAKAQKFMLEYANSL